MPPNSGVSTDEHARRQPRAPRARRPLGRTLSPRRLDRASREVELHHQTALRLGAADQRYTTKRQQLVDVLADAGRPLTMSDLLAAAPGVPQSSAYRNLAVLIEAGIVRRVQGVDENGRFELAEDLSGHHHHHLICTTCGGVEDVAATPRLERALAEAGRAAADAVGFQVVDHRIDLVGQCATCR